MDEVVAYLVEELAMDGESGTDIPRFLSFVQAFYDDQHALDPTPPKPKVDAAYGDCIWHWLSQIGSVKLGLRKAPTVPEPTTAPKGKTTKKKEGEPSIDTVHVFSHEHAHSKTLSAHAAAHPDDLRIVVDEDIVRLKITGSSVKNLLAAAPYAALQLVSRARSKAITATELGRTMGYDQKTVFYFVRRLIEAGLVAKFQAHETGTTSNLILHRRYWASNETYVAQQSAVMERHRDHGDVEAIATEAPLPASDQPEAQLDPQDDGDPNADAIDEDIETDADQKPLPAGNTLDKSAFNGLLAYPVMSRQRFQAYMNNSELVRNRLLRLLYASQSYIVARARLYERMGFPPSTRGDRKFFLEMTRRVIAKGLVEPVQVELETGKLLPCIRLTQAGLDAIQAAMAEPRDTRAQTQQAHLELQLSKCEPLYQRHITFERQLLESVKHTEDKGCTVNELAATLNASAKARRHVDEYMRACDKAQDSGMPDYDVFAVIEMEGRERRQRYWTRAGLLQKLADNETAREAMASQLESLSVYDATRLYEMTEPEDEYPYESLQQLSKALGEHSTVHSKKSAHSQQVKQRKVYTNPVDPETGTPRRGRPRKSAGDAALSAARAPAKRKSAPAAQESAMSAKKLKTANAQEDQRPASQIASSAASPSEPAAGPSTLIPARQTDGTGGERAPLTNISIKRRFSETFKSEASGEPSASSNSLTTARTPRTPREGAPAKVRIEFSAERRMACFMDLLEEYGGIIEDSQCTKAFDAFIVPREGDKIETFLKEVGDLRESKTRRRTVDELEKRGKVKTTTTVSARRDGGRGAQKKIVYKPDIDSQKLSSFIRSIMEGKELMPTGKSGTSSYTAALGPNIGQVSIDPGQADANDVINIIKSRPLADMLNDPTTRSIFAEISVARSQLYGLIPGAIARLQFIHHLVMSHLNQYEDAEQGVVSKAAGIFDIEWLLEQIPLELFVKFKQVSTESPELLDALQDESLKKKPISQQSYSIRGTLEHVTGIRLRNLFSNSYLHRLIAMGLAVPVEKNDQHQYTDIVPQQSWHRLYRFKLDSPAPGHPFRSLTAAKLALHTPEDVRRFWKEVQGHKAVYADCLFNASASLEHPFLQTALRRLSGIMTTAGSWFSHFQMVRRQQLFLSRFTQEKLPTTTGNLLDDAETLRKISEVSLVPTWVVERFIRGSHRAKAGTSSSTLKRRATTLAKLGQDAQEPGSSAKSAGLAGRSGRTVVKSEPSAITRDQVVARVSKSLQRRRALWRVTFEQICSRIGIDGVKKLKLEDSLSDIRDSYLEGRDGAINPALIGDMVYAVIAQKDTKELAAPVEQARRNKSNKGKNAEEQNEGGIRRRRKRGEMAWTRQQEELLRDACVILSARDRARGTGRSNWSALNQLFPDTPASQLRQRFQKLASAVGEEAYLAQLEQEWTELWQVVRGTALLPDKDFRKADGFNLEFHVKFLRDHIDKNKVLERVENASSGEALPFDVSDLTGEWLERDAEPAQQLLDLVHNPDLTMTNTSRGDALAQSRFALPRVRPNHMEASPDDPSVGLDEQIARLDQRIARLDESIARLDEQNVSRALAGLVMALNTPSGNFDEQTAVDFCDSLGTTETVDRSIRHLLETRVIRMEQREGRRLPGRNFVYTDDHRKSTEPVIPLDDLSRESSLAYANLASRFESGETVQVSFDTDRGPTVALAKMLIEGYIEVTPDVEQLGAIKEEVMFNAKSIMDPDIEMILEMKRTKGSSHALPLSSPSLPKPALPAKVQEMQVASFGFDDEIEHLWTREMRWPPDKKVNKDTLTRFKRQLAVADTEGLSVTEATTLLRGSFATLRQLCGVATPPHNQGISPVFMASNATSNRIVLSTFWCSWAVRVGAPANCSMDAERWVLPRSWIDIHGKTIESEWRKCVMQILWHILLRPGITLAHLCSLVRAAWSRAEVQDVIETLQEAGLVQQKVTLADGSVVVGSYVKWCDKVDEAVGLYAAADALLSVGAAWS